MRGIKTWAVVFLAGMWILWGATGVWAAGDADPETVDNADLDAVYAASGIAESLGAGSQVITDNRLEETNVVGTTKMVNSGNGNRGIVQVNQASGSMNNQLNLVALAMISDDPDGVNHEAAGHEAVLSGNVVNSSGVTKKDLIKNSFNDFRGIAQVNQAAGSLNNQSNMVVMAVGGGTSLVELAGMDSLSEVELADLGASNGENNVDGASGERVDTIQNSFDNFHGIASVTQSAGDLNQIDTKFVIGISMVHLK